MSSGMLAYLTSTGKTPKK